MINIVQTRNIYPPTYKINTDRSKVIYGKKILDRNFLERRVFLNRSEYDSLNSLDIAHTFYKIGIEIRINLGESYTGIAFLKNLTTLLKENLNVLLTPDLEFNNNCKVRNYTSTHQVSLENLANPFNIINNSSYYVHGSLLYLDSLLAVPLAALTVDKSYIQLPFIYFLVREILGEEKMQELGLGLDEFLSIPGLFKLEVSNPHLLDEDFLLNSQLIKSLWKMVKHAQKIGLEIKGRDDMKKEDYVSVIQHNVTFDEFVEYVKSKTEEEEVNA